MPRRPAQFRPIAGGGAPHRTEAKAERDAFYSSARWMRLRAAVLAESPLCAHCLDRDELTPATIAHHVEERLARPDLALDPANLLPLCGTCHTTHHNARGQR